MRPNREIDVLLNEIAVYQTELASGSPAGQFQRIKGIIENLPDINVSNSQGYTYLMTAVMQYKADIVKLLLEAGADPSLADKPGQTAFDFAEITQAEPHLTELLEQANLRLHGVPRGITLNQEVPMELVDLYDENRVPLGKTAERSAPREPGEYRMVVHVCVFDRQGRLLIQQRTPQKFIWPRLWDVSVGGGVDAGETSRQGAEREFREELGFPLSLDGLRPSVTVNFGGGFDDFYLLSRDLDLDKLVLQKEEVQAVRWAALEEILDMVDQGTFIPYPKSFLRFLFDMRNQFGFPTK